MTFQIPDNCEYAVSLDPDNANIIAVALKPTQKDPSTDFVEHVETFSCVDDVLIVDFELPDGDDKGNGNDNDGDPVTKKTKAEDR